MLTRTVSFARQTVITIAVIAFAGVLLFGTAPRAAEASTYNGTVNFSCTVADATDTGSHVLDRDNTGIGEEAIRIEITDGAGTLIYELEYSTALDTDSGGVGVFTYDTAPQFNPITFKVISQAGNGLPEQVDFVATGECAGLPTYSSEPKPGPDLVPIPDTAVGGAFVTDTPIYFAPRTDAATDIVMEQGKTVWVYGVDASGAFYKVMLAGKLFWVPVNTLGPNYDEVWNGTPLPTNVVE